MFESSYRLVLRKNGGSYSVQPESMKLSTCLQLMTPACEMIFLKSENKLSEGDEVVCYLQSPEGKLYSIFTGIVFHEIPLAEGRVGLILQKDISSIYVNISFVEETAENILLEILSQGGIEEYKKEIPEINIKRFSFVGTLKLALFSFLDLMNRYGSFYAFFDQDNRFCFLPDSSFSDSAIEFKTGKNILQKSRDQLTSFALPVLAGQAVSVDGVSRAITRSVISLSPRQSRTVSYWSAS